MGRINFPTSKHTIRALKAKYRSRVIRKLILALEKN